ncbi:MAG: GyrI-like domain-containing protein [Acidobacteria bacterium]|nr:GyrI-like domain-containing protein [Acidobacteriota bacterium]
MNLTENIQYVTWPETHYVFVERVGSIPKNAQQTWHDFHQALPQLKTHAEIRGFLSLYDMAAQVYRAGAWVASKPTNLPATLRYEHFQGGKYARFVLTGPYANLGAATSRVIEIISEKKIPLRDAYHIEHYVNDPETTREDKLVTEILFPV